MALADALPGWEVFEEIWTKSRSDFSVFEAMQADEGQVFGNGNQAMMFMVRRSGAHGARGGKGGNGRNRRQLV